MLLITSPSAIVRRNKSLKSRTRSATKDEKGGGGQPKSGEGTAEQILRCATQLQPLGSNPVIGRFLAFRGLMKSRQENEICNEI